MFGRKKRDQGSADAERTALFAALAERPETVCPFLGLEGARTDFHPGVTREHRCYAFGDPAELSSDQQERVCLQRGYVNCPRYLRGVLVIPTEELEALRRPVPRAPLPAPAPQPASAGGGGRRRTPLIAAVALLLVVGGGAAAFVMFGGNGIDQPTPTPAVTSSPEPSPSESIGSPTPFPETPVPDPTPRPGDVFIGFEVTVLRGDYVIYLIDEAGSIVAERGATFSQFSRAPVLEIRAPNGRHYWQTTDGDYTGYSYIYGDSGPFLIREVYQGEDGVLTYVILPDDRL